MVRVTVQKLRRFLHHHRHALSALSLVVGFAIDNFTLRRTDRIFENLALVGYLFLVGGAIILFHYLRLQTIKSARLERLYLFLPFVIQFAFGGLFSGFTIFYGRSGSLASSGLFIALLFCMMVATEFFKKQYQKIVFQITALFSAFFFMLIYVVPILTGQMGDYMFLLSGGLSIVAILVYIAIAEKCIRTEIERVRRLLSTSIAFVFVFINLLYFTHSIPPIPLILKNGEVAHSIIRTSTGYTLGVEADTEKLFSLRPQVVHTAPDDTLYVFSSIFAPTKISTRIVHVWQHYDEMEKKWVNKGTPTFVISGGRDVGYRGYTYLSHITPGRWRVDVTTSSGQVVGRIRFTVSTNPSSGVIIYTSR